jgi:hypothetical protein
MSRLSRLLFLLSLALCSLPSYAEDFVIEVPIKLQRMMDDVGEVMVTCEAMNEDEDKVGEGRQKVAIEGESYEGTVEVSFDADYGKNPNDATMYTCTMRLRQIAGREYRIPQSEEEEPDWPIWARARQGTELVYQVKGEIAPDQPPGSQAPEKK